MGIGEVGAWMSLEIPILRYQKSDIDINVAGIHTDWCRQESSHASVYDDSV